MFLRVALPTDVRALRDDVARAALHPRRVSEPVSRVRRETDAGCRTAEAERAEDFSPVRVIQYGRVGRFFFLQATLPSFRERTGDPRSVRGR